MSANLQPTPLPRPTSVRAQENPTLEARHTPELVIGLVGPVGAGVTTTAQILSTVFHKNYGYDVSVVDVSDIITSAAEKVLSDASVRTATKAARVEALQRVGSELRKRFSNGYLAEKCVERIATERINNDGYDTENERAIVKPRRLVHIIDSIKHPSEVELLREVYGDTFWLIGVFAPDSLRKDRLEEKQIDSTHLDAIIRTDEEEGVPYGQRVRDTMYLADFFVRNDGQNHDDLSSVLARYLAILFDIGVQTPTIDESAMYAAASAATGSACLSRQVGAAIYSSSGELIGVGKNDVPKAKGGLYATDDGKCDHRCFKWKTKICHNDAHKEQLYMAIYKELAEEKTLTSKVPFETVRKALKRTRVKDLIEFSRAVHAEMEAIISVARASKHGIVGATLYTTTFPCHSCARHIVASGITRVVYIEPYTKSLALDLHSDAVTVNAKEIDMVRFLQYEGVAPKNIIRLFNHGLQRKEDGKLLERDPKTAFPVFPSPLDGFSTREQIVVNKIKETEERITHATETPSDGGPKGETGAAELPLGS